MRIVWITLVISIAALAVAVYGLLRPLPTQVQANQQQGNKPGVSSPAPTIQPGQRITGGAAPTMTMPPATNVVPPLYTPAK